MSREEAAHPSKHAWQKRVKEAGDLIDNIAYNPDERQISIKINPSFYGHYQTGLHDGLTRALAQDGGQEVAGQIGPYRDGNLFVTLNQASLAPLQATLKKVVNALNNEGFISDRQKPGYETKLLRESIGVKTLAPQTMLAAD